MTEEKKGSDESGENDWEKALSEWENTSFTPQVAKDAATDKPASPAGGPRPLYRPPPIPPAAEPKPASPPVLPLLWPSDEAETGVTRMARVPAELLRDELASSSHGGLAQIFGREAKSGSPPAFDPGQTTPPPPEGGARALVSTVPPGQTATTKPPGAERAEADDDEESPTRFHPIGGAGVPPSLPGPALLAPNARHFDPNDVTVVGKVEPLLARWASPSPSSETLPARPRPLSEPSATLPSAPLGQTRPWFDEKPASEWLSPAMREGFKERALWLEEEARATQSDPAARARGLLACSEICACLGERDEAQALAAEARDLVPSLLLAHKQARALLPSPIDEDTCHALDAEIEVTRAGAARSHLTLLAAETRRAAGQEERAAALLAQAAASDDLRAVVLLAARSFARGEDGRVARREVAPSTYFVSIAEAIEKCRRLRGLPADGEPAEGDSPGELLLRARRAIDEGHAPRSAEIVAGLARLPELGQASLWLAASLAASSPSGRVDAARWLGELTEEGDLEARRALLARALELDDRALLSSAMGTNGPLSDAERVVLATLGNLPLSASDPRLDGASSAPGMKGLAAAATALVVPAGDDREAQVRARAERTVGGAGARATIRLGRLLAASAPTSDVEGALAALDPGSADAMRVLALETASQAGRWSDVGASLETWGKGWGSGEEAAVGSLAAALVAERAGERPRALEAFKAARTSDPTNEAALRAIAGLESVDLVAELNQLAGDLGGGLRAAIARIEAVARSEGLLPEPTRAHMLEQAHEAAPSLTIASFLAERIARKSGDIDEVLRWVRERRARTTDPVEAALDGVREALLIADREHPLAADRLHEAHLARPHDVALRQLYERMATVPPESRALWREERGVEASGDKRTLMLLEAAHEYERSGDEEGALRCAEAAGATDGWLGAIARERAELRARRVARLADDLLSTAKGAGDGLARREAYERLAAIDELARQDSASTLLWNRSILEESPLHLPSLRYVEHHLIGEGRDQELEPIASAIATALRGTGAGECTAHAELAARLRTRAADARWESAYDMVELAATEAQPSLWSLRMMQAHARSRGDDAALLSATLRIIERSSRPSETASLLVRAGEAASRLDRLEDARPLLQRACAEDPGDVMAWSLLADLLRRADDPRGAAEACESLARVSAVREHQVSAWYEAGRAWQDDAGEEDRAIAALEAAAALDVTYKDVFDRLSLIYAVRKMQPELASLLERRLSGVTDVDERVGLEVRRARVLLEAGDKAGARAAFDAALAQRPDDPAALAAFADLCETDQDWEATEQALVRLARLVPTAEEQRAVYSRLGALYAHRLVNLPRAEVALKEVLRHAPGDVPTLEELVSVCKRQDDAARAAEFQQELVTRARSPEEKRKRFIDLSIIHEETGRDHRKAEQTLEAARREFPQDVGILRALAEFYARHQQTPAYNILLDRAGADARRALTAGRISPTLFDVLATVFELRGKKDAERVTKGMLAALQGQPSDIEGAGDRALDASLDDLLAPEAVSAPLRTLLAKTGEALDAASPLDLRALKATPLAADNPLVRLATRAGQAIGLPTVQVLVSSRLGAVCHPAGSVPPTLVAGEALLEDERMGAFVTLRALKLVQVKASAVARLAPADVLVLVSAWFRCFTSAWEPQGVDAEALASMVERIRSELPRELDPDLATIALEAAGATQAPTQLGAQMLAWANRAALLALGDPNAALDAIAAAAGRPGAPVDAKERATWVARTPEARDLLAFAVSDAFSEARAAVQAVQKKQTRPARAE